MLINGNFHNQYTFFAQHIGIGQMMMYIMYVQRVLCTQFGKLNGNCTETHAYRIEVIEEGCYYN